MKNIIIDDKALSERSWEKIIMNYNKPDLRKSIWQICNSFIPYIIIWFLMYQSLRYSYWLTLVLIIIACGFLIRMFIIFHDCGHGSFFKKKNINDIVGIIMGIFAFTPYYKWHTEHRIHHATAGNLDKRGIGDVWTLTLDEYQKSSKGIRFLYRAFRNPFIMFSLGPLIIVMFQNRITKSGMTPKEKNNVYFTNCMIILMAVIMSLWIGLKAYLLIQVPLILIAHSMGLWLFYVQHQFDNVSWERNNDWDYETAAIQGSSFLRLPVIFQWFTGNIGFHHVHHLSSRIPNYNLSKCHYNNDLFKEVKPIKLFSSFKTFKLNLWDEVNRQMISVRRLSKS